MDEETHEFSLKVTMQGRGKTKQSSRGGEGGHHLKKNEGLSKKQVGGKREAACGIVLGGNTRALEGACTSIRHGKREVGLAISEKKKVSSNEEGRSVLNKKKNTQ